MKSVALVACCTSVLMACGPTAGSNNGNDDAGAGTPDANPFIDMDGDGYPAGIDCDDNNRFIFPGAIEDCDDGVDNNCNGIIDNDLECLDPCEAARVQQSYFGCTIYAVDLPQFSLDKVFGISVSNPSNTDTATVTISTLTSVVATLTVPPRGVATYEDSGRAQNISTSGLSNKAFRIDSDIPVAAYQFNSLDTIGAASTDASLLFADHNLAKLYFSMDYTSFSGNDAFIAVVGTEGGTTVTITPSSPANGATTGTIGPQEVMVIIASGTGTNLTGSRITASKPVAVFGGNRCTQVPNGTVYCDHLEQQIFPRQAMGTRYVVGKTHARVACNPPDYIRVLADVDNTTITFTPAVAGPWTLNAGQWMETPINESVEISADHPLLIGQFIRSSNSGECNDEGDPAFMLQVPSDQFRQDYIFLTPPTYQTDYVDIIAPIGASVMLDSNPITLDTTTIGSTNFTLTSVIVQDGAHVVESNMNVGVMVYGFGGPAGTGTQNVSYGYPAGLNLNPINPVE